MADTSNNFEITGVIVKIFPTEQKSDKFKVREFVIETADKYPQMVKFQAKNDRCDMIEAYTEGEEITVSFNLQGREWQGKYFTTLEAWKIKRTGALVEPPIEQFQKTEMPIVEMPMQTHSFDSPDEPFKPVGEDGLPF